MYQPEKQVNSSSWKRSIVNSQVEIESILQDNPSLRRELPDIAVNAYPLAIRKAASEKGIDSRKFPKKCPWTVKELLTM